MIQSNANSVSEFGGPFGYLRGNVGEGVAPGAEYFAGNGPCSSIIDGFSTSLGFGASVAPFEIHGGVTWIATQTTTSFTRNSLRPVFIGQLATRPDGGCELAGTIGPDPAVRTLAIAILAIGAASFIAGTLATVLGPAIGRPSSSVLSSLAVVGISVIIIGFTAGLSLIGTWLGRDAGAYLRQWLLAQLS